MPIPLTPSNLALVSRRSNQLSKIRFSVLGSRFIGDGAICFAPILPVVTRVTSYILSSIRSIGRIEERFDGYSKVISLESLETEESIHVHRITRGFGRIGGRLDDRKVEARRTRIRGRVGVDKNKRALFFNDREARPLKSCLLAECSRHCPNYSRIPREPLSLLLSLSPSSFLIFPRASVARRLGRRLGYPANYFFPLRLIERGSNCCERKV